MFFNYGYQRVSMNETAQAAGISRPTGEFLPAFIQDYMASPACGNIVIPCAGAKAKILSISSCVGAVGASVAAISVPTSKKNFSIPPALAITITTASSFPIFHKKMRDVSRRVDQTSWAMLLHCVASLKSQISFNHIEHCFLVGMRMKRGPSARRNKDFEC